MKPVNIDDIAEELSDLLPIFHKKLIRPIEHQTKNLMSPMLMHTIMLLYKNGTFSMTELSNELKVSKQQMTSIIDKLIENKFVYREHDASDRRSIKIGITSSGLEFCHTVNENVINDIKSKIEHLDKDDLLSLHNALNAIYKIFYKIP